MEWINWFKKKNKTTLISQSADLNDWQQGLSGEQLLTKPNCARKLREIVALISVTQETYFHFYLMPLRAFAAFTQQLPHPTQLGTLLEVALERVVFALKRRRGYMLPIGADTETCYREQDVWTYAVFLAALLQECWLIMGAFQVTLKGKGAWQPLLYPQDLARNHYRYNALSVMDACQNINVLIVDALLPEKSLEWLKSYRTLFASWRDSISFKDSANNPIIDILNKTQETRVVISLADEINPIENKDKIKNDSETIQEKQTALSETLINYIKQALEKNTIKLNQTTGFVHHVEEGILLVIPAIFTWLRQFPETIEMLPTDHEKALSLLTKNSAFIKNPMNHSYLHSYFVGRWEKREVITGLVLPTALLFHPTQLPLRNEQLQLDTEI